MALKSHFQSFLLFVRSQGVVGLAIGFILGGAVSKVVTSLVNDIIQPLIGLIFGSVHGLSGFHLGPVMFGTFLSNAIDFLIICTVVYVGFKVLGLEKLDKKE